MITQKEYLYEFLVRGNPDGTIKGCHCVKNTATINNSTGEVLAIKQGEACCLDKGSTELNKCISDIVVSQQATIDKQASVIEDAKQEAINLRMLIEQYEGSIAKLKEEKENA